MNPRASRISWWRSALCLILAVAVALIIGLASGQIWLSLCVLFAGLWGWQVWNGYRLEHWLRSQKHKKPTSHGLWRTVFDTIDQRQQAARQRHRALAQIVRELRDASKALPDALLVLNENHQIRWFNSAAQEFLGLRKNLDLNHSLTDVLDNPQVREWAAQPSDGSDIVIPSPVDGTVLLRLRMFQYADRHWLMLARDVTALQRIEGMRKDFVANVSHELRTPLTVVSGYLETMHMEYNEEWGPIVERLQQQCVRMKIIIEDLLTLSRLDSTSELKDEEPVAIAALLRSLVADAAVLSEGRHHLTLNIKSEDDLRGSSKDLRSAFVNLLSNAVRYTPEGGRIEISWQRHDDRLAFSVKDDGPGIAAQHIPRLTERFYRVSVDRSRSSGGTGLGLAIVKHVLALHQARLSIVSKPGHGSEFTCYFPPERIVHRRSLATG